MSENDESKELAARQPAIQPTDVAAGLGAADRALLATCIALFEDTALRHRVEALYDQAKGWVGRKADEWRGAPTIASEDAQRIAGSIQSRAQQWQSAKFSDEQLRMVLWMYLRESFDLPALTCISTRSASRSCDDLTARLLCSLAPGWFQRLKTKAMRRDAPEPVTLDGLARQMLEELMRVLIDSSDPAMAQERERLIAEARDHVQHLNDEDRAKLLQAIGADELNDAAIRKILLTGGGLTLFSASVWWAGFSAYILAAQASAFIPLVSGPALVSLVSVVSNPISVIAITAGGGWWMTKRVQQQISVAVAMRVIALLAMNGLCAGPSALRTFAGACASVEGIVPFGDLKEPVIQKYRRDWHGLAKAWGRGLPTAPVIASKLEHPAKGTIDSRLATFMGVDEEELRNTAALSVLTIGDVLWHMFAINPEVMQAADFSHVADLGNAVDFVALADRVEAMDAASRVGEVSDLKGYVAERLVASQLTDAGYQVEFPVDSNQPGWDISVDGVKVQIKDTDSLSYLQQHFEHYGTQYPVIVNNEMARSLAEHHQDWVDQHQAWADHVYVVDGYSNELVEHLTHQSLAAGATVDHPHVPMFTLALSAYRNYRRYSSGRITGEQAAQQVLLDGGSKMALAGVGSLVGPAVGLFVFGPAGALIFGTVVPIVSQMQSRKLQGKLDKLVTSEAYRAWSVEAKTAFEALVNKLKGTLEAKAAVLKRRIDGLHADCVDAYLRWRAEDELACLREAWCRLRALTQELDVNIEVAFADLLAWLGEAPVHSATYQAELKDAAEVFKKRPELGARIVGVAREGGKKLKNVLRSVVAHAISAVDDRKRREPN